MAPSRSKSTPAASRLPPLADRAGRKVESIVELFDPSPLATLACPDDALGGFQNRKRVVAARPEAQPGRRRPDRTDAEHRLRALRRRDLLRPRGRRDPGPADYAPALAAAPAGAAPGQGRHLRGRRARRPSVSHRVGRANPGPTWRVRFAPGCRHGDRGRRSWPGRVQAVASRWPRRFALGRWIAGWRLPDRCLAGAGTRCPPSRKRPAGGVDGC